MSQHLTSLQRVQTSSPVKRPRRVLSPQGQQLKAIDAKVQHLTTRKVK